MVCFPTELSGQWLRIAQAVKQFGHLRLGVYLLFTCTTVYGQCMKKYVYTAFK